ncbi:cobyric acid synthase [Spirochaeta cellobiosiphila]|uniref:cobyric acid synthase n=1 Tax=Spirochaeta cellobiosiphila TaxID=504483 RepID=UPI000429CCBB|nr:cobyric acid synthase [Spirochaeta cellobiosiphila]
MKHGGHIAEYLKKWDIPEEDILDYSANINPLGYPDWLRAVINIELDRIEHYPEPHQESLKEAYSQSWSIDPKEIIFANGATEILFFTLFTLKPSKVLLLSPSYGDYRDACLKLNIPIIELESGWENNFVPSLEDFKLALENLPKDSMVILGNPNNPSGLVVEKSLIDLCQSRSEVTLLLDESFIDLTDKSKDQYPTTDYLVMRSLTKAWAIPGLRLGYLQGPAPILSSIEHNIPQWSVNRLAAAVGRELLTHKKYLKESQKMIEKERNYLKNELKGRGFWVAPGEANFLLFRLPQNYSPSDFYDFLASQGLFIRLYKDVKGLDDYDFRIAVKDHFSNSRLIERINAFVKQPHPSTQRKHRLTPKRLMILGTASNAGKSLMVMAFCRIFRDLGYSVAPFKAQNMSLNSFVTSHGEEIGRAQALQALAAGIEADARMNPVLLKPTSDQGSQIIVCGKPWDQLQARAYYQKREYLWSQITQSYENLSRDYDMIIMEGAGSPGEINLKKYDMVNMAMAKYAQSPVLLTGDIDKGGVYASFYGHMNVMAQWERNLVKGFLVNKFRGDVSFLTEAHDQVLKELGKPVVGIIPYQHNHGLPEEDSVSYDLHFQSKGSGLINLGIVRLGHLSNFTDIAPFQQEEVNLISIDTVEDMDKVPLHGIILPGTKRTIEDLRHLKKDGRFQAIKEYARRKNSLVIGICGGFQMMGLSISDNLGIEEAPGTEEEGLGLLPLHTQLMREKHLVQMNSRHKEYALKVAGYEIHHGATEIPEDWDLFEEPGLGAQNPRDNHWGSYLHGIFDNDDFRHRFLQELLDKHHIDIMPKWGSYNVEAKIKHFTEVVRESIDMDYIKKIMGL